MVQKVWVSEIYLPLALELESVILDHVDLLDESEMPACLLTLCAHINEYRALVTRWEAGDTTQVRPDTDFPSQELRAYSETAYRRLRQEQRRLLGDAGYGCLHPICETGTIDRMTVA